MSVNPTSLFRSSSSVIFACLLVISWILNISGESSRINRSQSILTSIRATPSPEIERVTLKVENLKEESNKKPLDEKEAVRKAVIVTTPQPEVTTKTLYRLNSESGTACILLRTDALLIFTYTTKLKEEIEKDIYVPESVEIDGDCSEDTARLEMKWSDFVLRWYFEKTPGGERWFVDKVELWFDSSNRKLEHIKNPDQKLTLSTPKSHSALLFVTPVGQAYTCMRELEIKLTNPKTDVTATLLLRELEVQPFIFKYSQFGQEYQCPAPGQAAYRSETAPLIVGSLLAFACLAMVTGYSIFRYFKIKKVQYDTME